ncbi:MAG TPA: hypothetical protein VN969_00060 [Streptosporangiaceae bacterium]|nr:hypothetical protein [Streptosporangiaceae bacterium]
MPRTGQPNKTGGVSSKPASEVLGNGERADRVVFAREDEHWACDHAQQAPRVEA